jgi:Ca-activated chloride channel family protein
MIILFMVLMILAAAEPRSGRKPVTGERSGLDVALAFDVSRSMLAQDIIPSRLDRSITALRQLTAALGDTRFSLIPFKGDAFLAVPMTEDRVVLDLWMARLTPSLSTAPGTDVESALRTALRSFPGGEGRSRVVVLISDGESLSGGMNRVSRELAEAGVPVFVLAAGTAEGGRIPVGNNLSVLDSAGDPVVSRADFESLRRLAEETGGSFYELSQPGASSDLIGAVENLRMFSDTRGIHFVGVYRYRLFLVPALIFLFLNLMARIVPWRRH